MIQRPPNYRDVGEALGLWLEPSPVPCGRLLRGGKFDQLATPADIGDPRTILNLRRGPDPSLFHGVDGIHVPASNDLENYDTSQRTVRAWLEKALGVLAAPATRWPVYVHCTSGRDRTGIVVAASLLLVGLPRAVIIEEFLLSDGAEQASIELALDGIERARTPLQVDLAGLRRALLGEDSPQ